jgi:hypothetical protein
MFMAAHILNCSVDMPDIQPDYIPENLSYNDMESIIEIVLEKVFKIENAIVEYDEKDTDDRIGFEIEKQFTFFYQRDIKYDPVFDNKLTAVVSINYLDQFFLQFHPEIVPPPPKA